MMSLQTGAYELLSLNEKNIILLYWIILAKLHRVQWRKYDFLVVHSEKIFPSDFKYPLGNLYIKVLEFKFEKAVSSHLK